MEKTIQQLQSIIENYTPQLQSIHENALAAKPNLAKWSKKEILGHLIDSAQRKIRRFIVAQYEDNPKIMYAQDAWVAAANYQNYVTKVLITLWVVLNKYIGMILQKTFLAASQRLSDTNEPHTIQWLVADYNKHTDNAKDYQMLYLVPQRELGINKLLIQNPGW